MDSATCLAVTGASNDLMEPSGSVMRGTSGFLGTSKPDRVAGLDGWAWSCDLASRRQARSAVLVAGACVWVWVVARGMKRRIRRGWGGCQREWGSGGVSGGVKTLVLCAGRDCVLTDVLLSDIFGTEWFRVWNRRVCDGAWGRSGRCLVERVSVMMWSWWCCRF